MKCSQACCPFWVQLSVKFNVCKRTKKTKHHAWEYKANHSFVLIFFSWATWFKKEMAYSDYATGADMEGGVQGHAEKMPME